jgi:hypothetical protein
MAVVQKIEAQIGADDKQFRKKLKDSQSAAENFSGAIKKIGIALAGAFAIRQLKEFASQAMSAANAQLQSENKLLVALKGREDSQKRLIKQAQELQALTLFGDEVTIESQALMASLGMTEDQITKLMPKVQDMATALNMDLVSASSLVAKSITSSTNALQRYGISIDATASASDKAGALLEQLTGKFDGQAEAAAKVALGPLTQLKNMYGDLTEEVGKSIINAINPYVNALKDSLTPNITLLKQAEKLQSEIPKTAEEFRKYAEKLGITEDQAKNLATAQQALIDQRVGQLNKELLKDIEKLTNEYNTHSIAVENLGKKHEEIDRKLKSGGRLDTYEEFITKEGLLVKRTQERNQTLEELSSLLIEAEKRGANLNDVQLKMIEGYKKEREEKDKLATIQAEEDAKEVARLAALEAQKEARLKIAEATAKQYEELSKLSNKSQVEQDFLITENAFTAFEEATKKAAIDYDALANSIIESSSEMTESLGEDYATIIKGQRESIEALAMMQDQAQMMGEVVGTAFGQAASGQISFQQALIQSTGQIVTQYLRQALAAAIARESVKGLLGIATATAAVAAISAMFRGLGAKGGGSMGGGGGGSMPSVSSPTRTADTRNVNQTPVNITGNFRMQGKDLVAVIEKTDYSNSRVRG